MGLACLNLAFLSLSTPEAEEHVLSCMLWLYLYHIWHGSRPAMPEAETPILC